MDTIYRMVGTDTSICSVRGLMIRPGVRVDLLIESDKPLPLIRRAQIKMQLESLLGLPVDIISKVKDVAATSFQAIEQINAVKLSG